MGWPILGFLERARQFSEWAVTILPQKILFYFLSDYRLYNLAGCVTWAGKFPIIYISGKRQKKATNKWQKRYLDVAYEPEFLVFRQRATHLLQSLFFAIQHACRYSSSDYSRQVYPRWLELDCLRCQPHCTR